MARGAPATCVAPMLAGTGGRRAAGSVVPRWEGAD